MRNKRTVARCTAVACVFAVLAAQTAFAAPGDATDTVNDVWAYRVVADVDTQLNIRAGSSIDSAVIGCLPRGASADLIERGEEWSLVISGGVEGYVKNEFLAFGERAEYLAEVYGTQGVKTCWDGVRLFAEPDAAAAVVSTAGVGSEFTLLADQGLWYLVQTGDGLTAYVPAEDVQRTILTERAVSYVSDVTGGSYAGTEGYEYSGQEDSYDTYTEDTYDGVPSEEDTYQDSNVYGDAASEDVNPQSTDTTNADDLNLLAAIIYCEAGNQSRDGKIAVGAVVLNRVASGSFPNTVHDVIYQSGQFTPAYSGGLASALANGVPADCVEAASAALNGENPVGGALYFNTGSGRGVKIGAHQFY